MEVPQKCSIKTFTGTKGPKLVHDGTLLHKARPIKIWFDKVGMEELE